jgi:hypothetical protein
MSGSAGAGAEVLWLLPLSVAERRAASLVCSGWKAAIDDAWADEGITVDDAALDVLLQPRWQRLTRLRVRGHPNPAHRVPFDSLPVELPRLWHLCLDDVKTPLFPGMFTGVFRRAPSLRSLDMVAHMYLPNYAQTLRHARCMLISGARALEHAALRGRGLVMYPSMELGGAAAVTAMVTVRHALDWPPVLMPRLRSFTNTGKQFSAVVVDAPLHTAEIEEPDEGPWIAYRLGVACDGLRRLTWTVPAPPSPASSWPQLAAVQRFDRLQTLVLHVCNVRTATVASRVLASLAGLPHGLRRLAVRLDIPWPFGRVDWGGRPLAHLRHLVALDLEVPFAATGLEAAMPDFLGAPSTLAAASLAVTYGHECDDTADDDDTNDADDGADTRREHLAATVAACIHVRPALRLALRGLPRVPCETIEQS